MFLYEMRNVLTDVAQAWEKSDTAKIVVLKSCGGKGFCAGGDVKSKSEQETFQFILGEC